MDSGFKYDTGETILVSKEFSSFGHYIVISMEIIDPIHLFVQTSYD